MRINYFNFSDQNLQVQLFTCYSIKQKYFFTFDYVSGNI